MTKKRLQTFVPDSTYRWLETVAAKEKISVSQVASDLIRTVEAGGTFSRPAFEETITRDELNDMFAVFYRQVMILIGSEVEKKTAPILNAVDSHETDTAST